MLIHRIAANKKIQQDIGIFNDLFLILSIKIIRVISAAAVPILTTSPLR